MTDSARSPWIVSGPVDAAMILAPFLATALILCFPAPDDLSLAGFLLLVVAFDVAHVWATIYISYLDGEVFRRRRLLFLLPIPITILVAYRLHLHSPVLFWSLMAYVAIHHFASQQYGFVALYKLRSEERSTFDRYLDRWTLWVGALGPIVWWHTTDQTFDWFGHGEVFLVPLMDLGADIQTDIVVTMALVAGLYGLRQVQHLKQGTFNLPKNLWMLGSWASWSIGIAMTDHPLVSLACINLYHGIPFLILVWYRTHRHWTSREEEPGRSQVMTWLTRPRNLWAFYGILLLLALAEEGLWEGLLWGNYLPRIGELSPEETALAVALLATPQIVHYYLDAWLWKLDGSNPDLHVALGLPPTGPAR